MAALPAEEGSKSGSTTLTAARPGVSLTVDGELSHPTAGAVLHRVLAASARTFLLNDLDGEPESDRAPEWCETVDSTNIHPESRPLWAETATGAPDQARRRPTETERIHQSRIAMRRIRSNLRTFRLVLDPSWSSALRAELAWYGRCLGGSRDLHIIRDVVESKGAGVIDPYEVLKIQSVISTRLDDATATIAAHRNGARRFQLTEQMMILWDGPDLKAKAERPAEAVLPGMLERSWRDLRGAARRCRKEASEENLHALRIRMKDLRYGCETVALIDGGPARSTARAAERLQIKLGDHLDAAASIAWFEDLAREQPDLSEPLRRLVKVQRAAAAASRKGWKGELKEVERRWRRWHA